MSERSVARAHSRYFTVAEERVIREHYATLGPSGCADLLPDRTIASIYRKAQQMGIRCGDKPPKRTPYESSDWIDAQISKAYARGNPVDGVIRDLSRRIDRPRHWICERARKLGVLRPRTRQPAWSNDELDVLEMAPEKSPRQVQLMLKRRGYERSETAIVVQRKRIGLRVEDPDRMTAREVGRYLGVDSHKVNRWISGGYLKAKRKGTARVDAQGGDMWSIERKGLRDFLIAYPSEWDHRRCEQIWLIEILAGRVGLTASEAVA